MAVDRGTFLDPTAAWPKFECLVPRDVADDSFTEFDCLVPLDLDDTFLQARGVSGVRAGVVARTCDPFAHSQRVARTEDRGRP